MYYGMHMGKSCELHVHVVCLHLLVASRTCRRDTRAYNISSSQHRHHCVSLSHWITTCKMFSRTSWSIITSREVVGSIPAKPHKTECTNLHGFELHRPSSKGTKWVVSFHKSNRQSKFSNFCFYIDERVPNAITTLFLQE